MGKPIGFYKKGGKTRPITKPKRKRTRVVKKVAPAEVEVPPSPAELVPQSIKWSHRKVPEEVRSRVCRVLEKVVPEQHYRGATFEWRESTDPTNRYYGEGPHGIYLREKDTLVFRPLKSLRVRTVVHEVGHRVYGLLDERDRRRWMEIVLEEPKQAVPWGPKAWMAEEFFAEFYTCFYYPRAALCSISRLSPDPRRLFDEIMLTV